MRKALYLKVLSNINIKCFPEKEKQKIKLTKNKAFSRDIHNGPFKYFAKPRIMT